MDMQFYVFLQEEKVGMVTLKKQGMYYQLEYFCDLPMTNRYHLMLMHNSNEIDLGCCIPYRKGFGLKTRVKCTEIENREPRFGLILKNMIQKKMFIPVFDDKPFEPLERLENAYFQIQAGQACIVFRG